MADHPNFTPIRLYGGRNKATKGAIMHDNYAITRKSPNSRGALEGKFPLVMDNHSVFPCDGMISTRYDRHIELRGPVHLQFNPTGCTLG